MKLFAQLIALIAGAWFLVGVCAGTAYVGFRIVINAAGVS